MADYIKINPNAKNGELSISKDVFEQITLNAIERNVKNAALAAKPVKVTFLRNGKVKVVVCLTSENGALDVKEAVNNALLAYVEAVPFEVEIKIVEESK